MGALTSIILPAALYVRTYIGGLCKLSGNLVYNTGFFTQTTNTFWSQDKDMFTHARTDKFNLSHLYLGSTWSYEAENERKKSLIVKEIPDSRTMRQS